MARQVILQREGEQCVAEPYLFHLQDGVDQVVADLKGQEIHEKAIGVVCVSQQHILRQ